MGKQAQPKTAGIALDPVRPKVIPIALALPRSRVTGRITPTAPTHFPAKNGSAVGANQ
jgi:hypothetical protein